MLARVAGFDHAVYGLPEQTAPILFEHPDGPILVATTKLSQAITGRFGPTDAWGAIWDWIVAWACPDFAVPQLVLTPTVRPSYGADGALPVDVEEQAIRRGVGWTTNARLLIHPAWQAEAERRLETLPDGTGAGPDPDWPVGDGRLGMIEGASARIHPDGTQDWRYHVRNDCIGETSMAMAFGSALLRDVQAGRVAANLNDFIYAHSVFAQGPRADPGSPSYGLLSWTTQPPADGVYYGDDNARSMLGTIAAAALLGSDRWDLGLMRCLLANLRTTGPLGFRGWRLDEAKLQANGWRVLLGERAYAPSPRTMSPGCGPASCGPIVRPRLRPFLTGPWPAFGRPSLLIRTPGVDQWHPAGTRANAAATCVAGAAPGHG